jgi:hypothetical protein
VTAPHRHRLALLGALAALASCEGAVPAARASWPALIAPYAPGREVTRGYVLAAPTRGHEHDVVLRAARPADGLSVEVHIVDRGRWAGVRETRSFGVAWEAPHTTAPRADAEAVTEALAVTLRASDRGGPVDAIALGAPSAPTPLDRLLAALRLAGSWQPAPWWLLAAVCTLAACGRSVRLLRDDAALALAALALRVALGAWAPFHVNGQGPLWIDGALHPEQLRAYGPGWHELYGPLARLVAPDRAVFAGNVLLAALLSPLAAAVARRVGLSRGRALVAGALVAADPVLVRIAATESYFTALAALSTAAMWSLLAAPSLVTPRLRVLARVGGALAAVACARIHPLGWIAVATVPLVVGAGNGAREALRAGAWMGVALVATSGCVLADVYASISHGATALPTWWTPAWMAFPVTAALALHPRARRLAPSIALAALFGGAIAATFAQSDVWRQAALRVVALPALLGLVALAPDLAVRDPRRATALSLALALVALVAGRATLLRRTTDEREYAWARRWMRTVPPACRVTWVAFAGARRTVFLPTWEHAGASVALDARGPLNARALLEPLGCTWYVRTTACDARDGAPACEAVERGLSLERVAGTTFPAEPSHRWLPYRGATASAAVFRVRGFARPEGDGR